MHMEYVFAVEPRLSSDAWFIFYLAGITLILERHAWEIRHLLLLLSCRGAEVSPKEGWISR